MSVLLVSLSSTLCLYVINIAGLQLIGSVHHDHFSWQSLFLFVAQMLEFVEV